ncbi:hypothetical protein AB0N05_30520 [Nocardia sp. NPDC051030]|uniref:hypothetical protein n=1 Tax=Nocardia sp. NPDC051030 TaxID=3155162 RepID=UPI003433D33B
MVLIAPERDAVVQRLMTLVWNEDVNAIIVPSHDHLEPADIEALVKFADVICADTGNRFTIATDAEEPDYPKRIMAGAPPLRELPPVSTESG